MQNLMVVVGKLLALVQLWAVQHFLLSCATLSVVGCVVCKSYSLVPIAWVKTGWSKTASMKGHITVWGKICGPQREELHYN